MPCAQSVNSSTLASKPPARSAFGGVPLSRPEIQTPFRTFPCWHWLMRQFSRVTSAFSALANPSLHCCLIAHIHICLLASASQGPGCVVVFRRDIIALNGHFVCVWVFCSSLLLLVTDILRIYICFPLPRIRFYSIPNTFDCCL